MWRAVVSQPFDRYATLEAKGDLDVEAGEFWVDNPFMMPEQGHNLSAFETNCLFLNHQGQQFLDASFASGADIDSDSRSVIAADFDGDQLTDLLVASVGGGPLRLFSNRLADPGNVLRLKLEGVDSNRMGTGSRVVVTLADGRRIVRDLFSYNGFQGQGPLSSDIGVGKTDLVSLVEIRWPSGTVQQFKNISTNKLITIREGSDQIIK